VQQSSVSFDFCWDDILCNHATSSITTDKTAGRLALTAGLNSGCSIQDLHQTLQFAVQARRYAFKCHRKSDTGDNTVYPVNAIAFHPFFGTFASGGMLMTLHVSYKALDFVRKD